MAGLACIELSTATPAALYTPAMLVGVIFVAIVGDRRMQLVIDIFALALIAVIGWVQGLRGAEFAVSMVVYASTIAVVNLHLRPHRRLDDRADQLHPGPRLAQRVLRRRSGSTPPDPTSETFAEIFARGLPYVASMMPAERVAVFTRTGCVERFTLLASWPDPDADVQRPGRSCRRWPRPWPTTPSSSNPRHCVLPVGYASDGELVMVIERSAGRRHGRTSGPPRPPTCWPPRSCG